MTSVQCASVLYKRPCCPSSLRAFESPADMVINIISQPMDDGQRGLGRASRCVRQRRVYSAPQQHVHDSRQAPHLQPVLNTVRRWHVQHVIQQACFAFLEANTSHPWLQHTAARARHDRSTRASCVRLGSGQVQHTARGSNTRENTAARGCSAHKRLLCSGQVQHTATRA